MTVALVVAAVLYLAVVQFFHWWAMSADTYGKPRL